MCTHINAHDITVQKKIPHFKSTLLNVNMGQVNTLPYWKTFPVHQVKKKVNSNETGTSENLNHW